MRLHPVVALAFLVAAWARSHAADSVPLAIESRIELGDVQGRIDHLAVDPRAETSASRSPRFESRRRTAIRL